MLSIMFLLAVAGAALAGHVSQIGDGQVQASCSKTAAIYSTAAPVASSTRQAPVYSHSVSTPVYSAEVSSVVPIYTAATSVVKPVYSNTSASLPVPSAYSAPVSIESSSSSVIPESSTVAPVYTTAAPVHTTPAPYTLISTTVVSTTVKGYSSTVPTPTPYVAGASQHVGSMALLGAACFAAFLMG